MKMQNKLLKTILITGFSSICASLAFAAPCGDLKTFYINNSSLDWQFNQDESWYDGDADHGDYTTESTKPNEYAYIFKGETDNNKIQLHNSRDSYHLNVYTVYNSGRCKTKDKDDDRLCANFITDGGRVELWSFRDKDSRSNNDRSVHVQVRGDVEDGKEFAQELGYKKKNAVCGNDAKDQNNKAGEVYFSLLDLTKQNVTTTFQFDTEQKAAIAAQRAYTYLDSDALLGLDQMYGEPFSVEHTPDSNQVTFTFRRACSKQQAEATITTCMDNGSNHSACEASSCYYQEAD
jgi:hypothetical protein